MDGLILTEEDLRREVAYFLTKDAFAWDTETMDGIGPNTRGRPEQNRVVWLSMATYGRTIVIPMGHPNGDILIQKAHRKKNRETGLFEQFPFIYNAPPKQLKPSVVFAILQPLFFNPNIIKIAHNAPFDLCTVAKYFGEIPCEPVVCTIVYQWILNEEIGAVERAYLSPKAPMDKGLKNLTKWYYGVDYDKDKTGRCIENHPFSKVAYYSLLDAKYPWLLYLRFKELIEKEGLTDIRDLENSVTRICAYMDLQGAYLNIPQVEKIRDELTIRLEKCEAEVYRAAGKIFNINSTPQKQIILYGPKSEGNQGLKTTRKTKTGNPSTDKEALKAFEGNPVVDALLEYSEVNKLLSTYINAYIGKEDEENSTLYRGRVHTDLVQYGTVTGRFSSRNPNLQNIPNAGTPLGKLIRGMFSAPKGYKLLVADYGQMELRILASYIGHGGLYDGFWEGIDAHTQTAALIYNIPVEKVQKHMRQAAKTINFAIVYGAGEEKVANTIGISLPEAKKLLKDHKKAFPEIYAFKDLVVERAKSRKTPYITTILGRKRRLWDLNHYGKFVYRSQRQAVNSLIQGSLGDIIKLAMVRMYKALSEDAIHNPGREIKMILSVHDELVLEVPEDRVEEASAMLMEAMTGKDIQDLLRVPVDIGKIAVVDSWADAKD